MARRRIASPFPDPVRTLVRQSCGGLGGDGTRAALRVKRNKTDAADACALLEAARCADITPIRVKSIEERALQGLHRTRSLWMATRTSRINALRGFCREFGIIIAQGSRLGVEQISRALADPHAAVPSLIRGTR